MNAGIAGALIGSVLGIVGGFIGTWFSIRRTQGPKERAFMIRACVIGWIGLTLFLVLMLVLPNPYRHILWIPYGILLPLGIIKCNHTQIRIRAIESPAAVVPVEEA